MHPTQNLTQYALKTLKPFAEQFPIQYINGNRNCRLAYRHLTHTTPSEKLIILVNGRAENILKWTEPAYEFYQQGYDVLVFDHRGQGYSDRLLKDTEKGHLDEFRFYADDMAKIIENCTAVRAYSQQQIVAHSLGSLIASYYLANFDHQIKSAVFSSPFFGVPLKHPVRDEILLSLMILLGQGERYVFGKSHYQPVNLHKNDLSLCKTRMRLMNIINQKHTEIHLGGPTFRWVHLCLQAIKKLPKILPRIETPVLILEAEQEKIVDNKNLAKFTALLPQGKLIKIPHAKHEILFEQDQRRAMALAEIQRFLQS
ncbi:hydrolase [Pasteurellaceae bacterium Pebbles2]|nr:hydrolase [Pasteurellaceae bacterium Pebbles2]